MTVDESERDIKVEFLPAKDWKHRAKWRLLEEYVSANGEITVPPNFITDGASIPPIFRMLFSPTGRYFGAAIVHDYILVKSSNWPEANKQFEEELKALHITKWRRFFLVTSVRLWGWVKQLFNLGVEPLE